MNIYEVLRLAWKSLLSNKMRSVLTMLGIIIGVAAVIVMIAINNGTEAAIASQVNGLGANLIFISANFTRGGPNSGPQNDAGGLVFSDVAAIANQVPGVAGVSVEQDTDQNVKAGDNTLTGVTVVGTTTDYTIVRNVQVADGRFFTDQENTDKPRWWCWARPWQPACLGTANRSGRRSR